MKKLMHLTGEDFTHLCAILLRVGLNVFFFYIILANTFPVTEPSSIYGFNIQTTMLFLSINTALYTTELFENIQANYTGTMSMCVNTSYMCEKYGFFCDQPSLKKDKEMLMTRLKSNR